METKYEVDVYLDSGKLDKESWIATFEFFSYEMAKESVEKNIKNGYRVRLFVITEKEIVL